MDHDRGPRVTSTSHRTGFPLACSSHPKSWGTIAAKGNMQFESPVDPGAARPEGSLRSAQVIEGVEVTDGDQADAKRLDEPGRAADPDLASEQRGGRDAGRDVEVGDGDAFGPDQ